MAISESDKEFLVKFCAEQKRNNFSIENLSRGLQTLLIRRNKEWNKIELLLRQEYAKGNVTPQVNEALGVVEQLGRNETQYFRKMIATITAEEEELKRVKAIVIKVDEIRHAEQSKIVSRHISPEFRNLNERYFNLILHSLDEIKQELEKYIMQLSLIGEDIQKQRQLKFNIGNKEAFDKTYGLMNAMLAIYLAMFQQITTNLVWIREETNETNKIKSELKHYWDSMEKDGDALLSHVVLGGVGIGLFISVLGTTGGIVTSLISILLLTAREARRNHARIKAIEEYEKAHPIQNGLK